MMLRSDRFQVAHDAEISVCTVPSTRYYRFCVRYDEHSLKFSLVIPTKSIRRRDRFSGSQLGPRSSEELRKTARPLVAGMHAVIISRRLNAGQGHHPEAFSGQVLLRLEASRCATTRAS